MKVRIGNGEKTTILPTGSQLLLHCEASGDPPLSIRWTKSDRVLDDVRFRQLSISSPKNNQILELNVSRVEVGDGGVYICLATNAFGSDATHIRLIVKGKFHIIYQLETNWNFFDVTNCGLCRIA